MAKKKAKATKRASTGKKSAMDVLVAFMKRSPNAVYADAQAACLKSGHKIYPIMWGRAQVMLGRVAAKPKGSRKKAAAAAAAVGGIKRGPGRPRKVRPSAGIVLPISGNADLAGWQQVVEGLNSGRKVALQYDGSNWLLAMI